MLLMLFSTYCLHINDSFRICSFVALSLFNFQWGTANQNYLFRRTYFNLLRMRALLFTGSSRRVPRRVKECLHEMQVAFATQSKYLYKTLPNPVPIPIPIPIPYLYLRKG
jgi:hypothetical protein